MAIVGAFDGTSVGGSFRRAAEALGMAPLALDVAGADSRSRLLRSFYHRLDRRRPHMGSFSRSVVEVCRRELPDLFIATGTASITAADLREIREMGVVTANYSTDDPWNPAHRSKWHMQALRAYDVVFTTRRANVTDFEALGCKAVHYLPFAYDEQLVDEGSAAVPSESIDVLFVGGADRDRARFMGEYLAYGPPPTLVGGNWERYPRFASYTKGALAPAEIGSLTRAARVNICLVRRANRDGHVMRTFEAAAFGGCMLVEDTAEHRELFGKDGECVRYFRTPRELGLGAGALVGDEAERVRLARSVRERILAGKHSYTDRLVEMIAVCTSSPRLT